MEIVITKTIQTGKILIKALIIGGLVLLLMIPAMFVQNLIEERQMRQQEAVAEVSSKWSGSQNLSGPFLIVPYKEIVINQKKEAVTLEKLAYFLPDKLQYHSSVQPEKRYRGIYEVMLYTSENKMNGSFSPLPLQALGLASADMLWEKAFIAMHISDSRGLKDELQLNWNGTTHTLSPTASGDGFLKDAFIAPLKLSANDTTATFTFSSNILLNGSEELSFTPVGKETVVDMESAWPDPSFSGGQLPETSTVSDAGFTAKWKSLSHKRKFPQAWKNSTSFDQGHASFGVGLFIPVTSYQKTLRSVKYAVLCIVLTFAAFFLIETVNKKAVHPFQYALIGLALILFYTLLLSFSEYISFNLAYAIAGLATVALIGWFVKGLLQSGKLSTLLSFILVIIYGYVFTILQLQDYALLLGSLGLFFALAIVMHFSRRINW
jgi:inner membrane protein